MLKSVELINYRCYEHTKITFKDLSIIVGSNNSGKSTIIETLRIISSVVKRFKNTKYITPPTYLNVIDNNIGIKVSIEHLRIDLRGVINFYRNTEANIKAVFDNNAKVIVTLNNEMVFANIYNSDGQLVNSRSMAKKTVIEDISIMPQLGLIKESEKLLNDDTIINDMGTYLSSRHFRNELLYFQEDKFDSFKSMAEETWNGLRIRNLSYDISENEYIQLLIQDDGFTSEIGLMGSGLQMWLQIIWFICRSNNNETIILDEPDVYMHPDLQRKILRIVKSKYKQVIIATHSVEIISDVEPKNILMIDKKTRRMAYAGDMEVVQNIVDNIGGVQNLSLTRLGIAKKCIFVEGKDIKLLSKFNNILYPDSNISLETLPCIPLGGWTRFNEALGAARLFFEETGGSIKTICILDRDYHLNDEIDQLKQKAQENHLNLFIWDRKEIENYLLIPEAIFRLTQCNQDEYENFREEYEHEIDSLKNDVIDEYASQILKCDRSIDVINANPKAREFVDLKWANLEEKLKLVNGKDALNITNGWIRSRYNKNCSKTKILEAIEPEDISIEIKNVINALLE